MLIHYNDDGSVNANETFLAAIAEIAAITDPAEREAAGAQTFGKRWVDVGMMWHTEGGQFG